MKGDGWEMSGKPSFQVNLETGWHIISNDDKGSDEIKANDMLLRGSEGIAGAGIVGGGGLIQIVVE